MNTDGLFGYRVVCTKFKNYNEPISLYPLSDIHYNNPNFAFERWESFWEEVRADKNEKLFLILGDTMDTVSTSERRHFLASGFHDTTVLKWEKDIAQDVKLFLKDISPMMKGRTISVFSGNHYFTFHDGTTTDMAIAGGLDSPFIGTAGFIVLNLVYDKGGTHRTGHEVKFFCHHGTSDARMRECRANFRCDVVFMGHKHTINADLRPDIECRRGMGGHYRIVQHETRLVRCGSFLKSYESGMSAYPVRTAMPPAALGCPKVLITPVRKKTDKLDDRYVDIKVVM